MEYELIFILVTIIWKIKIVLCTQCVRALGIYLS